ncbi:hypothetical protein [Saprospira grandis]|uniref:Uncharacterized protein n=1 Tax=Saprospira grandis (strain Lewin) TaxID=984262 RepID=H6KZ17_SAPGL|nr:hypothetical protein [Saprospira grandis]AFC23301.1 hypothetical protein SGRA_0562 [Saprospira grandis str. Lewin]
MFFNPEFLVWSLSVLPWAKAHACKSMQTGGLKPFFAENGKGFSSKKEKLLEKNAFVQSGRGF